MKLFLSFSCAFVVLQIIVELFSRFSYVFVYLSTFRSMINALVDDFGVFVHAIMLRLMMLLTMFSKVFEQGIVKESSKSLAKYT